MERMWIVVADEGRARFLSCAEPGRELTEMDELTDAGAHADNADLRRDAYGRRGSSVTSSAGEDKLDHEAELFARRVAAAPRFLGRLRKALDPEVAKSVTGEIDKDLLQLDRRELTQRLFAPPNA